MMICFSMEHIFIMIDVEINNAKSDPILVFRYGISFTPAGAHISFISCLVKILVQFLLYCVN